MNDVLDASVACPLPQHVREAGFEVVETRVLSTEDASAPLSLLARPTDR